jgi:hypothetical protein
MNIPSRHSDHRPAGIRARPASRLTRAAVISAVLATAAMITIAALAGFAAAAAPNPSRMVLRVSDLPSGFAAVRDKTGPHTNAAVIREKGRAFAARIRRWGRITGFRAFYRQRDVGGGSLPGVLGFAADVSLYRTARGAHASLADQGFACREGETIVPLAGHKPFGSDTLICTASESTGGTPVRVFRVQWRHGRATGSTSVVTIDGAITAAAAWTAAQAQNRHMTAELR